MRRERKARSRPQAEAKARAVPQAERRAPPLPQVERKAHALQRTRGCVPHVSFGHAEYAALEAYLERRDMPEAALDMSMLEGYLTGLAVGPAWLPTGRWLPRIWGRCRHSLEAVPFRTTAELREFRLLTLAFFAHVRWHVADAAQRFAPLFHRWPSLPVEPRLPDPWCAGFRLALRIERTAWRPLVRQRGELLRFSELYGTTKGRAEVASTPREQRRALADMAGEAIPGIVRFWSALPHREGRRVVDVRQENARLSYLARRPKAPDS